MITNLNEFAIENIKEKLPKNLKQILDNHLRYKNSKKPGDLSKKISQKDLVLLINYLLKNECLKLQEISIVLNIGVRTIYSKLEAGVYGQKYILDKKSNQYIPVNSKVIEDVKEEGEEDGEDDEKRYDEEEDEEKKEKISETQIKDVLDKLTIISENLSIHTEKLKGLEFLNKVRNDDEKVETETELDYGEFLICSPQDFGKRTMYMYHPLYEASKPIILKKYRLIYEFFNQTFFKIILEDYIKMEKEKNMNYIFKREKFNQYLNGLVNKYIL